MDVPILGRRVEGLSADDLRGMLDLAMAVSSAPIERWAEGVVRELAPHRLIAGSKDWPEVGEAAAAKLVAMNEVVRAFAQVRTAMTGLLAAAEELTRAIEIRKKAHRR